jgi:tyrosine-protein phosphatase YwqE
MRFHMGDKVVCKKDIKVHYHFDAGEVIALLADNYYIVEWDPDFVGKYAEESLVTEKEAGVIKAVQEAERNKIESEFETIRGQLQANLAQATELVSKSVELAKKHKKNFRDLKSECMPLFRAINDGGWSPSSIKC